MGTRRHIRVQPELAFPDLYAVRAGAPGRRQAQNIPGQEAEPGGVEGALDLCAFDPAIGQR